MKPALLRVAFQRQLAERRTGAGLLSDAQIQVRIEVNDPDLLSGESVEHSRAMTECRLMPAAENQRAFACAQAGGHRFAQRLLGGLQPFTSDADGTHIDTALVAAVAGHIRQRPA
ncbi:Uncharacterised protein [Raoultella ornithinolytica]|nr:Uncharacterised protein [Raoultella ornithinolytica]